LDIGPARRIIEIEPISLPLPERVPDLEPAPAHPEPAEPEHSEPEP